jgi:hypothetical protein
MSDTNSDTAQPLPYDTPMRPNSLFTHLNRDVRCLIYDLIDLPPVSHASLGLLLSCKEAYSETSAAAARNLNRYLKNKETVTKEEQYRLVVPKFSLDANFASLQILTIQTSRVMVLTRYHDPLSLISLDFSKITIVVLTNQELNVL